MILVTTIRHLTQTTTVTRVIHGVSRQRSGDGFNPFWQHFLGPFLGPHGEGPNLEIRHSRDPSLLGLVTLGFSPHSSIKFQKTDARVLGDK